MKKDEVSEKSREIKRKMPEVPDLSKDTPVRKTTPFLLDDFSSGAPANTTKP